VKTIPIPIIPADSFFKRLKGLMFQKEPLHEEGLWIKPCNSIHMCFMNFSIDAVFLDKNGQIIKTVEGLKPWRLVKPVKYAYSVLELPLGTIAEYELKTGELIILD
jgi:uncharacterized membrane protein (UPF0127 family)